MFQASMELCPRLLPAGCCHLVFVEPYHSLLFHLSFFSVMAFFRTAVVFLTLDRFPLLSVLAEDDKDHLVHGSWVKRGHGCRCLRSFTTALFFIIIRRCTCLSHPPSFHLFINSFFVCVLCRTLATEVNMYDFGRRFPLNGFTIASMIALWTTWWYFLIFNPLPKMRCKSVGAENHSRLQCTTHGTSILKSSTMLKISFSCWKIVLDDTHSWSTKAPAQTQFVQTWSSRRRSSRTRIMSWFGTAGRRVWKGPTLTLDS